MPLMHDCSKLLARIAAGETLDFIFFWGHRQKPDGDIGPSCCSQWYEAGFELHKVRYATAEHYMMAEKARTFGDADALEQILAARSPEEVKKIGRRVKNFNVEVWAERSIEIVLQGNIAKFSQNRRLGKWLQSTGSSVLVEASPEDAIWGIGLHRDDPRAKDPTVWPGKNLLGFAIMTARDHLFGER
jgi:ribA/ribD-fused uncharacterized protein